MRDYLSIGGNPAEEPCVQLGHNEFDTYTLNRFETNVFSRQLDRAFPDQPGGTYFRVKANHHEFGTYFDVEVVYDNEDEESEDYALKVEGCTPANWDAEAKAELEANADYMNYLRAKHGGFAKQR